MPSFMSPNGKSYNLQAFWYMMRKIWKLIQPVKFKNLGGKVMLVEFSSTQNKQRIICEGPWSFDMHLVMTNEVDGTQ